MQLLEIPNYKETFRININYTDDSKQMQMKNEEIPKSLSEVFL